MELTALNQPPPLVDVNWYATDLPLVEAVKREGGLWGHSALLEFGRRAGSSDVIGWGFAANDNPPKLRTHDRFGNRIDEVEFHPAWHQLMALSVGHGLHAQPWSEPKEGAHVVRTAGLMLLAQVEAGHLCPISMTYSAVPALRKQPDVAAEWLPRLLRSTYDPSFAPPERKRGVLFGMGMTEKQGGSDVRANVTRAEPIAVGGPGCEYLLSGHKWFCSAPMCDAFLILAQAAGGLSCFLVPRWTPDGLRNRFFIQRLKDKLGNRSNASSEIELDRCWGRLLGEEGRGVPTILEMVSHTRLDCATTSAALIRQALVQALHHAHHRSSFQRKLIDHPLMRNVLADLAVESEAATALGLRLARAFDRRETDRAEAAFARVATAIAKFWLCKRAPSFIVEALESLGGNGYVEESGMPRLFRESPLNSIWEGSGNVICLDVLRALSKEPEAKSSLLAELEQGRGADKRLDSFVAKLEEDLSRSEDVEANARRLVERLALALQASLLVRHAPAQVADAFCATRLKGDWGRTFGTLASGLDLKRILDRAIPS